MPATAVEGWLSAPPQGRRRRAPRATPPTRRAGRVPKGPRRPGAALVALVVFSLLASFFAWVSAEPLWLSVGHGDRGTATVTKCRGGGVNQRCVGEFTASDGAFTVDDVAMLGVASDARRAGAVVPARMVSADSRMAYAADLSGLYLRWAIGLALVLVCGLAIALATGARRLDGRRARLGAYAMSIAAPVLIAVGFLAAAF